MAFTPPRISPAAWDEIRFAFHGSPLVDASLSALARNIDGRAWPLEAAEECPSAYVDLSHDEALGRLRSLGLPPNSLDELAEILRATLAFDESFGALAAVASEVESGSDPVRRNLERLGIPEDFPVELCAFTPGTRHFCLREGVHTLGAFIEFSRGAARSVIVGGEFRELLNALIHVDEATLARFLPFRAGATGLHLVEALGHLLRPLGVEERIAIARLPQDLGPELHERCARLLEYFAEERGRLSAKIASGLPCSRLVVPLEDLSLESAVAGLLTLHCAPRSAPSPPPPAEASTRRRQAWRPRWWPGRVRD
jgi:hypothetical protein